MVLILPSTNLCPRSCEHFRVERKRSRLNEYCDLPDGEWILRVRHEQLTECPLGKWDLKAEMGCGPTVF